MPKRQYERREPTDNWQQLRPLLKDPTQIQYEIIRPVILWGETPKERAAETGVSTRTIYYRANLFDAAGMASLLPPEPPPLVPKQDKRALPPSIRQEIVDLYAEYPSFRPHEIATICFVKFGRRPSPQTVKLVLASGPKPSRARRFKNFLLYGEQALAGEKTLVNIFQETLALEYEEQVPRYSVEWQPDDKHLLRVGNPRLYDHPFQSPQLPLWESGEVEWHVIIRCDPPTRRRQRKGRVFVIQLPLFAADGTQG